MNSWSDVPSRPYEVGDVVQRRSKNGWFRRFVLRRGPTRVETYRATATATSTGPWARRGE